MSRPRLSKLDFIALSIVLFLACVLWHVHSTARRKILNAALIRALDNLDIETIKSLLAKGADIDVKAHDGQTPLIVAALEGDTALVKNLLERGAEINAKGIYGRTALMWAAAGGNDAIIQLLLDKGADVNARDNEGATALMRALNTQGITPLTTIRLLLERGAEANVKDNKGKTALWQANQNNDTHLAQLLQQAGAKE